METNCLEKVITQEYTIGQAKPEDVVEAFYIIKIVLADFIQKSIVHPDLFTNLYPNMLREAQNESLYILKNHDISLGLITISKEEPDEFKDVKWESNHNSSLYISRLFVLPKWRNKGVGSALIAYAEELARLKGFSSVKLDVTSSCNEGILLLMKHKYRFAGNIFMNTQKAPINCYEKKI